MSEESVQVVPVVLIERDGKLVAPNGEVIAYPDGGQIVPQVMVDAFPDRVIEMGERIGAITASSAFPLRPPADWFDQPEPDTPQPLTYHGDGRVTGHLALWDQCHVGFLPSCVKIQRGDDFSSFHTGALETADGEQLPIGKVMFGVKHASTYDTPLAAAAQHYDDNGHVAAYVRAKEGRFGIWLSGAVKSDLSETDLRDVRANPPSGDWREKVRGRLSLISALAVPIPGFPIPQVALAASGDTVTALIMAGYDGNEEEVEQVETVTRSLAFIGERAELVAAALTTKRRDNLPTSAFAVPETRSYPIYDREHAANALARSSGKPEEARVRRAVCRRYPDMPACNGK